MRISTIAFLTVLAVASPVAAQQENFHPGPAIERYGKIASVDADMEIPKGTVFRIAMDVSEQAELGKVNKGIERVARLVNMLAAAGIPKEDVHIALVVHGGAVIDLLKPTAYAARREGEESANTALLAALLENDVEIYLCGQAAAAHGVAKGDVVAGVEMALSAITAHALLQQQGYTLNPF